MFLKNSPENEAISHILLVFSLFAQTPATISGYVTDASSGEKLTGATIFVSGSSKGTTTNEYGYFSLSLPPARVKIEARFVGFEPFFTELNLISDTIVNFQLRPGISIGEVEIKAANQKEFLLSPSIGVNRLTASEVEKIPAVLGEPDLLKAIQLLPGVSFATEGSTGFSVRGGSPDQTLIQLDGVPVYNVNHLWGFMSAFNNDAVYEAKLYKGSLPARFGGRLSSVLDVGMKEGNLKKRQGTFSLSPIAGHFTLEGPLKKRQSFIYDLRPHNLGQSSDSGLSET